MPGSKEEDFKRTMHFQYVTYGHALAQEPCPGGHEIYNFGKPLLCHHYYKLSLTEPCLGVEKNIVLRNKSMLQFLLQNYLELPMVVGVVKFIVSCLFTLQMLNTKFG